MRSSAGELPRLAKEEDNGTMQSASYTPAEINHVVREVEAVSWSEDDRIAVTCSETIHVFVSWLV